MSYTHPSQQAVVVRKQCAVSKDGQSEYRTFRLHSVENVAVEKEFTAKNERVVGSAIHIGASRAGSKIWNSYCHHAGIDSSVEQKFTLIETTVGGTRRGKLTEFSATRELLEKPYYLEKVAGKLVRISSLEEASNPNNVIEYRYKNKVTAIREED